MRCFGVWLQSLPKKAQFPSPLIPMVKLFGVYQEASVAGNAFMSLSLLKTSKILLSLYAFQWTESTLFWGRHSRTARLPETFSGIPESENQGRWALPHQGGKALSVFPSKLRGKCSAERRYCSRHTYVRTHAHAHARTHTQPCGTCSPELVPVDTPTPTLAFWDM